MPWKRELAAHSRILAWKIPWTEEPGRLQSMGLKRDTTERLTLSSSLPTGAMSRCLGFKMIFFPIPELQVKIAFE